jgi:hypothetical protein
VIPATPAWIATYGKAVFAGLAGAGSVIGTGLVDGSLDQVEIVTAIIAFCVASGLTGAVSNAASSDPVDATTGRQVGLPGVVKQAMTVGSTTVVRAGDLVRLESGSVDPDDYHAEVKVTPEDGYDR